MIELRQQLKLTPQLVLTPQLKLLLKVLQLNTIELNELILQEAQVNPFIEVEFNDTVGTQTEERPSEVKLSEETEEERWFEPRMHFDYEAPSDEEGAIWEKTLKAEETLSDYLTWQVRLKDLTPYEFELAKYIIGNLDDKGYLRISSEEVAKEFNTSVERVEKVRRIIKFLDPVGVASFSIEECLDAQLEFLGYEEDSLPRILVKNYLKELAEGLDELAKKLKVTKEELEEAVEVIKELDPYPARNFFSETQVYVEPDLVFYKDEDGWKLEVTKDKTYSVRLNEDYKKFLKIKGRGEEAKRTKKFLREKLRDAETLLKAIDSRYSSLYKVGEVILRHQVEFLEKGTRYLKPLTLKVIAEETGLHESTVSRIISHKFVQTPSGVYPLKFFLSTGYTSSNGQAVSSKAVKDYIKEIIDGEDKKKPYSDSAIAKILKEKYGITIARRTVTKYREALGIPSIRERRQKS
ncbi:MAG: RNA polymerase factor sigma-54 [Thermodesulfobacteria bacterium]|nr:RNA polymerase factor sigma-54 [Thermodesulfobacteriota bacterium]